MSKTLELKNTGHKFIKTNLMTKRDRLGWFDTLYCERCGVSGKRRRVDTLEVDGRFSDFTLENCSEAVADVPKKVRITNFTGYSRNFANIIEGSIHQVIEPPDHYRLKFPNSRQSVWITGVCEPARLLAGEFEIVE